MGKNIKFNMKFTTIALLAFLTVSTEAVKIGKKGDNGKGVAYDLDVPTLAKNQAASYAKAVTDKEDALNNKLSAFDDNVEEIHILNRKNRDLATAKENKDKSDASLKSNQDRVAWEKD